MSIRRMGPSCAPLSGWMLCEVFSIFSKSMIVMAGKSDKIQAVFLTRIAVRLVVARLVFFRGGKILMVVGGYLSQNRV
jgi:hypothetical protein